MSFLRAVSLRCRIPAVVIATVAGLDTSAAAQGVTTAAIHGHVRVATGISADSAVVRAVNQLTGFAIEARVRNSTFFIQGLESGVPYSLDVRRIGLTPARQANVVLALGEQREVRLTLVPFAASLDTLRVQAAASRVNAGGVGTSISDSTLRRLPTFNSDLYDFARLAPQVSTSFGLSGGGSSFRFNNYLIDGVSDRGLQGNNSPPKGISLDALRQYDVLLSAFDPRYGDFTGLLINAVTKSGTNELHGTAYSSVRNADLARSGSFLAKSEYHRELFGFSLGGPIVGNRVHFFIAPEVQRSFSPALGPYVGQPANAPVPLPVSADSVARFASLLGKHGLDAGDGSRVLLPNPNVTGFARLDVALPEIASRVVIRANYSTMDMSGFQRSTRSLFQLTSAVGGIRASKQTTAIQVFSQLTPTLFNELQVGRTTNPIRPTQAPGMPSIQVTVGQAIMSAGPAQQGNGSKGFSSEIGDYLVFQRGSNHTFGMGAHVEFFHYSVGGTRLALGQWIFPSLNALDAGTASQLRLDKPGPAAGAPVIGAQPSVYLSDDWRVGNGLSVMIGIRTEGLAFEQTSLYNPEVDAIFNRRTDDYPAFRPQWSPRLGFSWNVGERDVTTIRGGAGVFSARPPIGWFSGPMRSNGSGVRTLLCRGTLVPKFTPYPEPQPSTCSNGTGPSNGAVSLVDRHLNMAQTLRASLAVDRRLPGNTIASIEALYSRVRSDFVFVNLALRGPAGVDADGRVLYGTFDASGVPQPAGIPGNTFTEVVDLRNQSGGGAFSLTGRLHRPWTDRFAMDVAYTHSRVRDVQSIANASAVAPLDIWAAERPTGGRRDDPSTGVSSFEIPHRVVVSVSYAAHWRRQTTDISIYYIGESGAPITYTDSAASGLNGDLNANGTGADDPIYVPRNANDSSEMKFDSPTHAAAFERFIDESSCLQRQRGQILQRNSCRAPWVHTSNVSVRQSIPGLGSHAPTIQLDVFNVFNVLRSSWGLHEIPNTAILRYVGRTPGATGRPIFSFDSTVPHSDHQNPESGYQLQLSLRYVF